MRESLDQLCESLACVIDALAKFAVAWKDEPTLGFTHFQPAQLTTVGKRATLWLYDFVLDLAGAGAADATACLFRGAKGTTGTQASFLALFGGDHDKVKAARRARREQDGFRRPRLPGDRADVLAEDRHAGARRPRRTRPERAQVGHRPAAARAPAGDRRAVRGGADRVERDGVQAEPDARRAHVQPVAVRDRGCPRWPRTPPPRSGSSAPSTTAPCRRLYIPQAFLAADAVLRIALNLLTQKNETGAAWS